MLGCAMCHCYTASPSTADTYQIGHVIGRYNGYCIGALIKNVNA